VLVAGHLIPRKRPHLVVEAWRAVTAAHPSAVLLLAGSAKRPTVRSVEEEQDIASYQQSIFDSINAQGANVRWLGERSDMEVLYRAADVFAFPTEQEGFGNVILEAMASRLPVVCSEFRGFPKAEIGGVVALVHGDTVEAWAKTLLQLAQEPELSKHLGTDGYSLVRQKFTLDLVISQFHQVYQGVLKKAHFKLSLF
jgi:glycosyltransferase involved in cell wall biosynthesis